METILSMTISQLFGGIAGIIVVLSVFIEITPIKINPISGFLKWVGSKTNGELLEKFAAMDEKVSSMDVSISMIKEEADERNAINCRVRILQFGDEIRKGTRHSKENFDQVLLDIDDYEAYCKDHSDFKNNKTVLTKQKILEEYSRCIDNNDFL